jgi:hypothetical protein
MNPNTIDFYLELQSVTEKICSNLQKKNYSKDNIQQTKKLNPDKPDHQQLAFGENNKNSKYKNQEDLALMEEYLSS